MSHDRHLRCSFCGKSKDAVRKFISGPSVYICNECIALCNEILAEDEERLVTETVTQVPAPHEIKAVLDQYVIGQEPAKKALSVAVYNAERITLLTAGYAILAGLGSNTLSKIIIAFVSGGAAFGWRMLPGLVAMLLAFWVALAFVR